MQLEERLQQIKQQIEAGRRPKAVTIKTLLSWFGADRRGWQNTIFINEKLNEFGLRTNPNFEHEYIHSKISFVKKEPVDTETVSNIESNTPVEQPENIAYKASFDSINYNDPTYRIGKLDAAHRELVFVNPESYLSEAITQMITYDFSQLPVMQGPRSLKGVITWRSIGRGIYFNKPDELKVKDFLEPTYQLLSEETSLFNALPLIIEHDYVLVHNAEKEITGIVTASDLALQFQQLTEPFLLLSEIEIHIRFLLGKLDVTELEKAKDVKDEARIINSISSLTFGEYERLFQNPSIWEKLSLKIDRKTFCLHLQEVREIRNDVMHFNTDPIGEGTIEALRRFARLLQTYRSINFSKSRIKSKSI